MSEGLPLIVVDQGAPPCCTVQVPDCAALTVGVEANAGKLPLIVNAGVEANAGSVPVNPTFQVPDWVTAPRQRSTVVPLNTPIPTALAAVAVCPSAVIV